MHVALVAHLWSVKRSLSLVVGTPCNWVPGFMWTPTGQGKGSVCVQIWAHVQLGNVLFLSPLAAAVVTHPQSFIHTQTFSFYMHKSSRAPIPHLKAARQRGTHTVGEKERPGQGPASWEMYCTADSESERPQPQVETRPSSQKSECVFEF